MIHVRNPNSWARFERVGRPPITGDRRQGLLPEVAGLPKKVHVAIRTTPPPGPTSKCGLE